MNIFIFSTKPANLSGGSEVRNYYIYKYLKEKNNVVFYQIPLINKLSIFSRILLLLRGKIPYIEKLKETKVEDAILNKLIKTDIIQIQSMDAYYVLEKYFHLFNNIKILDTHNIDYYRFLGVIESKNYLYKTIGKLYAKTIKSLEINAINKFDSILVCSKDEQKYFQKYIEKESILIIPNGVDALKFSSNYKTNKNIILFMSLLSYPPNNDGIVNYIKNIHPKIKKTVPDIKLYIVGRNPSKKLLNLAKNDNSIILRGFVNNIGKELEKAKICICPIRFGSGTRLKILEYMAASRPIVSTYRGAEGINVKHGEDILLTDNTKIFSEYVIDLLGDNRLREKLSKNARKLILNKYTWENIVGNLLIFYKNKLTL